MFTEALWDEILGDQLSLQGSQLSYQRVHLHTTAWPHLTTEETLRTGEISLVVKCLLHMKTSINPKYPPKKPCLVACAFSSRRGGVRKRQIPKDSASQSKLNGKPRSQCNTLTQKKKGVCGVGAGEWEVWQPLISGVQGQPGPQSRARRIKFSVT